MIKLHRKNSISIQKITTYIYFSSYFKLIRLNKYHWLYNSDFYCIDRHLLFVVFFFVINRRNEKNIRDFQCMFYGYVRAKKYKEGLRALH